MHKPLIVITDDDVVDRLLFRQAIEASGVIADIIEFEDGEELTAFIMDNCEGKLPSVIVLDLNMPRKTGMEVLAFMKKNPGFRLAPVVILSTSSNPVDKTLSKSLGAVEYLVKPRDILGYTDIMDSLNKYLLQ